MRNKKFACTVRAFPCLLWFDTGQMQTVYPKKYAHGFVVLCFVVVMQSFIMNSHEVFIHIHQGCFAGTGAIVRLPQCQWSKPDGYGKISQCITTTKHSKAKTVCIFLGIYCTLLSCAPGCYAITLVTVKQPWKIRMNGVCPRLASSCHHVDSIHDKMWWRNVGTGHWFT